MDETVQMLPTHWKYYHYFEVAYRTVGFDKKIRYEAAYTSIVKEIQFL